MELRGLHPIGAGDLIFFIRSLAFVQSFGLEGASPCLLNGVSQLVRQKLSAGTSLRRILARAEDHITTQRIGERIDRPRRFRSVRAGMHAHLAEVVAEAWFEEGSSDSIQRLAGA